MSGAGGEVFECEVDSTRFPVVKIALSGNPDTDEDICYLIAIVDQILQWKKPCAMYFDLAKVNKVMHVSKLRTLHEYLQRQSDLARRFVKRVCIRISSESFRYVFSAMFSVFSTIVPVEISTAPEALLESACKAMQ